MHADCLPDCLPRRAGKWPDDLEAVETLRTAFHLRLAKLLEEQSDALCEVWPDTLFVQSGGYTFTGSIVHEPTAKLLDKAGRHDEANASRRADAAPQHIALCTALGRRCAAFPPACRLVKRWLACQLFSSLLDEPLVELLAAAPFLNPSMRPPGAPPPHAHYSHRRHTVITPSQPHLRAYRPSPCPAAIAPAALRRCMKRLLSSSRLR